MVKANQVLPAVVGELIRKAPLTPEKVAFAWRMAVGPVVAKSTTVRLGSDGVLYVTAESAAWLEAVRGSVGLIRARLDVYLGDGAITRMQFQTGN